MSVSYELPRYSCYILMKLWILSMDFRKIPKHEISWKSLQREPSCSVRTDVRTDRRDEDNDRFCSFAKAPNKTGTYMTSAGFEHTILTMKRFQTYVLDGTATGIVTPLNPLKTKCRPLYLKTQSVPRCKHFSSRLQKPISLCCKWHKSLFVLKDEAQTALFKDQVRTAP